MSDTPTEPAPEPEEQEDIEPAPEPEEEAGENTEFHLLPNRLRLRDMTPEQRADLVERVKDWEGREVDRWREAVASFGS